MGLRHELDFDLDAYKWILCGLVLHHRIILHKLCNGIVVVKKTKVIIFKEKKNWKSFRNFKEYL